MNQYSIYNKSYKVKINYKLAHIIKYKKIYKLIL